MDTNKGKKAIDFTLPQYKTAIDFLNKQKFCRDECILDIGCGNGKVTTKIAQKVPQGYILGIDKSDASLAQAQIVSKPANLTYQHMDAQQLTFNERFDVITSFYCIQWIKDKKSVFKGIFQSLKPGGKLIMIASIRQSELVSLPHDIIEQPKWIPYFRDYINPLIHASENNYTEYVSEAGLIISSYSEEIKNVIFEDYQTFLSLIETITPHIQRIPNQNDKTNFAREILERYIQHYPITEDGYYQTSFKHIKLIAYRGH